MAERTFVRQLAADLARDRITGLGAMLAYYAVLSLFPMLVFVLSLALLVVDPSTVREGIMMAAEAMPAGARDVFIERVESLLSAPHARFALVGAGLALWGASRGAVGLMGALDRIHGIDETRSWLRRQVTAVLVTLAVALLGVIALGMLVVGPLAGHWISDRFGLGSAFDLAWTIGRWCCAGLVVLVVWGIVYRFLPDARARFRFITPGAIVGVAAWLGLSALFGLYLRHFGSYDAVYGALGGVIIFLTWLWLSSIAMLFGAEVDDVLRRCGHRQLVEQRLTGDEQPAHA